MIKPPSVKKGKRLAAPEPPIDSGREPPAFCFRYAARGYKILDCNRDQKAALSVTLHQLTERTWNELISIGRHKRGCEKITRGQLKIPVPEHITEEVSLWAFRFCGMAPIIGYRSGRIFHIICIDPSLSAYDH